MCTLEGKKTVKIDDSLTAGMFGWVRSIAKVIGQAVRKDTGRVGGALAKVLTKAGSKSPSQRWYDLRNKANKGTAATAKQIEKAKAYTACVALMAAGVGTSIGTGVGKREDNQTKSEKLDAGDWYLTIDFDAEYKDDHPAPENSGNQSIFIIADEDTDANDGDPGMSIETYHDNYNRPVGSRVLYESCHKFGTLNNKITLLQVWGGCCAFYDGDSCEADTRLFTMSNREDGQLRDSDNDAVSSYWCTFDLGCRGAP